MAYAIFPTHENDISRRYLPVPSKGRFYNSIFASSEQEALAVAQAYHEGSDCLPVWMELVDIEVYSTHGKNVEDENWTALCELYGEDNLYLNSNAVHARVWSVGKFEDK